MDNSSDTKTYIPEYRMEDKNTQTLPGVAVGGRQEI